MSYKSAYELASRNVQPLKGLAGMFLVSPPSEMDPAAGSVLFAKCSKHDGKWFRLDFDINRQAITKYEQEDLIVAASKALQEQCDGCIYERQHATTRFPEGAEI